MRLKVLQLICKRGLKFRMLINTFLRSQYYLSESSYPFKEETLKRKF